MSPSNKPLRQLAAEKLHGEGANPSQLGDPISMKAETSDETSRKETGGASDDVGFPKTVRTPPPSSGGSHEEKKLRGGHHVRGMMTDEIREGRAPPPSKSLEGDATSLKAEKTAGADPADHDNGPGANRGSGGKARGSKI
ncbi:hypothetical protein B0T24DRAFT_416652 [Lasiosphaeria ovina]|uniref:Uncharacterized protein n=1 Tax=Lasiosphaeria ovina TaxID=92902 RepID=A0AAE0N0F3_9PEZI|nr:hypothetical protein B0T24DRAFT_416652 [Lasiosphaeria ovina]